MLAQSTATGRAERWLFCMLFLFAWANGAVWKKYSFWGIGCFCLLIVEFIVLLLLVGILSFGECGWRYFTLRSPAGEHVIIAEEEQVLHDFTVNFYESVCPGLMQRIKGGSIGSYWFVSRGDYELLWENDSVVVRYYSYSYNNEGWREHRLPLSNSQGGKNVYNIGSLILGLAAWGLPLLAIGKKYRFALCCIGSLSCCAVSLLLQLLEVKRRVEFSDWSALMDTMNAVILAAVALICGVVAINTIALFGFRKGKSC